MVKRLPIRSTVRGEGGFQNSGSVPARAYAETRQLYTQLQHRRLLSPYAGARSTDRLATQLLATALRSRKLPPALHDAFARCARELVACEAALFELPPLPPEHSITDGLAARELIRNRLAFFENDKRLVTEWINTLAKCLAAIIDAVPSTNDQRATLTVDVPLLNFMQNATELVRQIVTDLMRFAPDPRAICTPPGANLATRITDNLLAASRTTFEAAQRHPERLRWPGNDRASPQEVIDRYLADTPMASLFDTTLRLPIPEHLRFESTDVCAAPGHGKTQAIQSWVLADIDDPARPAVVVIDSQGDAIRLLSRLERFNPRHDKRLIILSAADSMWPLKFNLFDYNRDRVNKLPIGIREEILEGTIALYTYIFDGLLASDLTGKQSMIFRYIAQWMMEIPEASITTLQEIMREPTPFFPHLDRLPPTAQDFIRNHLFASHYSSTRKELQRRIFHVLSHPLFERLFTHPKNGIDFKAALDEGKVIFIDTAKSRLGPEWSSYFGRIMIAMLIQALLARAADPERTRRPTYIYVDEAHEYLEDGYAKTALAQCRKYKGGFVLAHQNMEGQIRHPGLRAALMTTGIRYTGALSDSDAATLARQMRTSADFLLSMNKRANETDFACFVRGVTPAAVKVTIPFFTVENAPKMSEADYQKLLARIRAQVASPLSTVPPKKRSRAINRPSTDPDDFGEKY